MILLTLLGLARADDAAFRFLVPEDAILQAAAPSQEADFIAAQAGDRFGLQIEMLLNRAGAGWRSVPLNTPICHEDLVALTFTPSQSGYATVINQGTTGESVLLYPYHASDDNRISTKRPARFPAEGGFTVDSTPGTEGFLVFVSPEPLSWEAQRLQYALLGVQEPGASGVTREIVVQELDLRTLGPAKKTYAVGEGELRLAFTIPHNEPCPALP